MGSPSGEALTRDSMDQLFGPPRRQPLLCNTMRTLSRVYSLFPEENPFAQLDDSAHTPAVWQACNASQLVLLPATSDVIGNETVPRSEKDAPMEVDDPVNAEVRNSLVNHETGGEVLANDGSEMIIDELSGGKERVTGDKGACNEKGTSHDMAEVQNLQKGLLGIERILMDELDDLGLLQLSDEDVNLDILKDFDAFMYTDDPGNGSVPMESSGDDILPVEGSSKQGAAVENNGKDLGAEKSTSGGDAAQSVPHASVEKDKSGSLEVGDKSTGQSFHGAGRKETKVDRRIVPEDPLQIEGLTFTAQRQKIKGGISSSSKVVSFTEKGRNSGDADKGKTKKSKKAAPKDIGLGKVKHSSVCSEGLNRVKSGRADGKMQEGNMQRSKENLTAKLVGERGPTNSVKFQYTREQLMDIRKLAAVPEDILNTVKEISAQLHSEEQNSTVKESMDISVDKKGQLGTSVDKSAEDKASGILKKKTRGSSAETRKEKKKEKRRKKRAELNKKLGVKRLKLKPIVKPKVVSHCRHYLKGRCQEGEKCKFSHDVVPLTKSKPCCHFARQSCMKGDDCPFDHQLSKYPCNNFVETGFCGRGDNCLFSHKIPAKEGSQTTAGVSKGDTSLDQLCKSNSTQRLNASVSSSGITTPKNPKENLAARISQSVKAPKGLSFLTFGKPSLENSGKHEEGNTSKLNVDTRTSSQPNPAISGNVVNTLMSNAATSTPQRVSFLSPERSSMDSSGAKNQTSTNLNASSGQSNPNVFGGAAKLHETLTSFPVSLRPQGVSFLPTEGSSVTTFVTKSQANVNACGASGSSNPTLPGTAVQLSKTFMVELEKTLADCSGNKNNQDSSLLHGNSSSFSSFGKPLLHESNNNGQVLSSLGGSLPDSSERKSQIEKRSGSESGKSKAAANIQPQATATSNQFSFKPGIPAKSSLGSAQKALLSTLAFAGKYDSVIKMSSTAPNVVEKDEGTSASECKKKEPIKASAILELLYGGSRKEKQ